MRQDLVTGDWILIAPGRANRPLEFFKNKAKRKPTPVFACPFENLDKSGHKTPLLLYGAKNDWSTIVIPNKFPALAPAKKIGVWMKHGPYKKYPAIGRHELIITRDHDNNFLGLSVPRALEVFRAFRDRYLAYIQESRYIAYVSIFHNWGPSAGASIYHPHYQILAVPIVPPDVAHSLRGSREYFEKNGRCVHCDIIKHERRDKIRVIFENDHAIAFTPYVSRTPFEVRVFPKMHSPYFEESSSAVIECLVESLRATLKFFYKRLNDPDYNFFVHTAPILEKKGYSHYHWHLEIIPKISTPAGFELSTGIDINVVDPAAAAAFLRDGKRK